MLFLVFNTIKYINKIDVNIERSILFNISKIIYINTINILNSIILRNKKERNKIQFYQTIL